MGVAGVVRGIGLPGVAGWWAGRADRVVVTGAVAAVAAVPGKTTRLSEKAGVYKGRLSRRHQHPLASW